MRAAFVISAFSMAFAALPALAADPTDAIFKVERDFAAYTHDHGYTKGFFTYSAPDAIDFQPQAVKIHDKLAAAIATDPTEKPSKLLWRPYRADVALSGDLAWDMGPWTIEGGTDAGWFLTVWQKQADGSWKWIVDTGAGPDVQAELPPDGTSDTSGYHGSFVADPDATDEVAGKNAVVDAALAAGATQPDFNSAYIDGITLLAGDAAKPATAPSAAKTAMAMRPRGVTWTMDGEGASIEGDLAYTYGHATTSDGTYKGHYVRIWRKIGPGPKAWFLLADDYQSAK